MNGQSNERRLNALIGKICDDQLDPSELQELEAILSDDPAAIQLYVESVDLHTRLHRQQGVNTDVAEVAKTFGVVDSAAKVLTIPPRSRSWAWLATSVCISLVLGVFAGTRYSSLPVTMSSDALAQQIATLSSANDCRWSKEDGSRFEGQRLSDESLRLVSGIAVVRFDSDVTLTIEGPTQLDLVTVNRARLRAGKAVFSGMTDLDSFKLETPYSTILDEGTQYAVSVDPTSDAMEVHVFDGSVQCESLDAKRTAIQVDAGDAHRFVSKGTDESIPLAASRFAREPLPGTRRRQNLLLEETFDKVDRLDGQNGGQGWSGDWRQLNLAMAGATETSVVEGSIVWPGWSSAMGGGSLPIVGKTSLSRTLSRPIRMDHDAAYYFSFLVRKEESPIESPPDSWAFLTLRDESGHKIAISPLAQRGTPKLIHNGRTANASIKLQDSTAYLFVAKILAQRSKPDQVFVHVYAQEDTVDSIEPLTWAFATQPMSDDSIFDQLRVVSRSSHPLRIDDIRIGKTWRSVTNP